MRSNASVPDQPVHPDHEQLAAWQAGALDDLAGARIGAHLAGCGECAAVVSAVQAGRTALASLEEPELPPGLHERLAAAIEREQAAASAPVPVQAASRKRRRQRAWSGRVAAFGAAAALLLLVAGLIPLLRNAGGVGTQSSSGAAASGPATASTTAALPTFNVPGEYSADRLRVAVAGNPAVRDAYRRAAGADALSAGPSTDSGAAHGFEASPNAGTGSSSQSGRSAGGGAAAGKAAASPAGQQACLAQVRAKTSAEVRPAFFVDTVYRGRAATVLVTRRADAPDRAELWAFPRGDCQAAPFATEQVQVPSP
jgi:hypothetical protein